MDADEGPFSHVVCGRVADLPAQVVTNSAKLSCSECGEEVWVSPASQDVVRADGAAVICVQCAAKKGYQRPGGVRELLRQLTPGQREELAQEMFKLMFGDGGPNGH